MRNPPLQKDRCSVSLSVPRLQLAWRGWKREPPRAPTAPLISPQPPTSTAAGLSYRRRLIGAPRWTALGRRRRGGRLGWPPRASRGWRLGGRAAWAGGPSPALPVFLPAIRGSVPWNSSWEGEALFCVASSGPRPPLLFHPPRPPPRPARSSLGLPSVRGGSTRSGRLDPAVAAPTAQYHQPATAATVQDSTQSPLTRGHVGSAPHRRQSVKTPRPRPPTAAAAIVVAAVGDAADKKASPCGMEPVKTKVEHQTPPPPPLCAPRLLLDLGLAAGRARHRHGPDLPGSFASQTPSSPVRDCCSLGTTRHIAERASLLLRSSLHVPRCAARASVLSALRATALRIMPLPFANSLDLSLYQK